MRITASQAMRPKPGFTLAETLVVLGIIALLLFILRLSSQAIREMNYRPTIPDREPSDDYRVYLPSGFSIVRPPHWEMTSQQTEDGSFEAFEFRSPIANRPRAWIRATRWNTEPSQEPGAKETTFQGRPAWIATEHRASEWVGEEKGRLRASITAPRAGDWITIEYEYYGDQSAVPDMMWKYFETVACPSDAPKPTP